MGFPAVGGVRTASRSRRSVIRKRGGTGLQRGAPLSRGRPPAACFLSRKRKQAKSAHRGCGPYVPQGSNLRDGFVTLPARRVRDARLPIGLPPVGAVLRRSGVHTLRLGGGVLHP